MLACEQCRKRKVRCTGTSPCSNCQRHMQDCYFEHNRRRRGPRPKQRHLPNQNDVPGRAAVDPDPDPDSASASAPAPTPEGGPSIDGGGTSRRNDSSPWHDQITDRAIPFSLDGIDAWKAGLAHVICGEELHINSELTVSTEQILHLLLIFFATVNTQQSPIMQPAPFFQSLQAGEVSRHLCLAMCSAALRFSRHETSHHGSLDRSLNAEAREELTASEDTDDYTRFQQILSLSVLSLHELYCGNGLQAWNDITMAMNLNALLWHSSPAQMDTKIRSGMHIVRTYLGTSGILNSVGLDMQSSNACWLHSLKPPESALGSAGQHTPDLLTHLMMLFVRCQGLCRKDFTKLHPAPWSEGSQFMVIKREIDSLCILHAGQLSFNEDALESLQQTALGAGEYVLQFSILYAMQILLNRQFLSIGVMPTMESEPVPGATTKGVDGQGTGSELPAGSRSSKLPTGPRRAITFPGAPGPFCRERAATCIRSAKRVTLLCRYILDHGTFLLPPFLGYSLFLAGLVFLNQLHVEDDVVRLEGFIDHLKTIFTVLGAMRAFYNPACLWVDTLFSVHTLDMVPESLAMIGGSRKLFRSFFSRFLGVSESPYCTLSPTRIGLGKPSSSSFEASDDSRSRHIRHTSSMSSRRPGDTARDDEVNETHNPKSGDSQSSPGDVVPQEKNRHESFVSDYSKAIGDVIDSMATLGDEITNAPKNLQPQQGQLSVRPAPIPTNPASQLPSHDSSRNPRQQNAAPLPFEQASIIDMTGTPSSIPAPDRIAPPYGKSPRLIGSEAEAQGTEGQIYGRSAGYPGLDKHFPLDMPTDDFLFHDDAFIHAAQNLDDIMSSHGTAGPFDFPTAANIGAESINANLETLTSSLWSVFSGPGDSTHECITVRAEENEPRK